MNFITRIGLTDRTDAELAALLALISREHAQAKYGSLEWHGGMISLESIRHQQAKRCVVMRPRLRGPGF